MHSWNIVGLCSAFLACSYTQVKSKFSPTSGRERKNHQNWQTLHYTCNDLAFSKQKLNCAIHQCWGTQYKDMLTQQLRNSYCYSAWSWRFLLPPPTLLQLEQQQDQAQQSLQVPATLSGTRTPSKEEWAMKTTVIKIKSINWQEGGGSAVRNNHSSTYKGWQWVYQSKSVLSRGFFVFQGNISARRQLHPWVPPSHNHCWHQFWYIYIL